MEISPHGGDFEVSRNGWDKSITKVPRGWDVPSVLPVQNFAEAIQGKAERRCPASLGVLLSDLMDAIYESAESGKLVRVSN